MNVVKLVSMFPLLTLCMSNILTSLTNSHSNTIHLDFVVPSVVPLVRIKSDSTNKILSYVYICLLPSEFSLKLKTFPKHIYKNKCCEDKIDTVFNSPCFFTSNALIHFKQPMLVYEDYANVGVSIFISHITIFTFATALLAQFCFI